ncbi:threonine ammonia-lyase [Rhizorhabdus dicambivorans]|nr:pyridoxal-phosphate dependent enzyme [Rhizorhabdus dicambivorans]
MSDVDNIVGQITRDDIDRARSLLRDVAIRTPLVPVSAANGRAALAKAENIQPYGSFKIRCGSYAVLSVPDECLDRGLYTASAGNFGQGVAAAAARRGVPTRVYAPDNAARTKIGMMRSLGAEVIEVSFSRWWEILSGEIPEGETAHMVHPCRGREVLIGNATIGAEIIEDAPDIDAILVPFGGGGLVLGIAAAIRLLAPHIELIACEASSSTPFTSALAAGKPVAVESDPDSFIDGIGGAMVLPSAWPLLREYVAGTAVVDDEQAAAVVAMMFRKHRLIVEGAGAVPIACALTKPDFANRKVAAIMSGGNIDEQVLTDILRRHS